MNCYWLNQIRRADVGLIGKAIMWFAVVLRPMEMRRRWQEHVAHLQRKLDMERESASL